jgi:hypothetical protein
MDMACSCVIQNPGRLVNLSAKLTASISLVPSRSFGRGSSGPYTHLRCIILLVVHIIIIIIIIIIIMLSRRPEKRTAARAQQQQQ